MTRTSGAGLWIFRVLAAMLLVVFLPPFEPIGNAVYRWVARNRHRLGSGECSI